MYPVWHAAPTAIALLLTHAHLGQICMCRQELDVNMWISCSFHVARGIVVASRSRGVCGMTVSSRLFHHVPFLLTVHQDKTTCQPQLQSREGTVYVHVSIQRLSVGHLPIDCPHPTGKEWGFDHNLTINYLSPGLSK